MGAIDVQSVIDERIKNLRNGVVMTQDDLAAAAGVSTDLIRKLEQGRRHTASIGSLHRIAAALDVDLGEPAQPPWQPTATETKSGSHADHAARLAAQVGSQHASTDRFEHRWVPGRGKRADGTRKLPPVAGRA
ncbi:MAG: helix-turn-helix domain-containing protein [Pseudonocardiaceae bacterium]